MCKYVIFQLQLLLLTISLHVSTFGSCHSIKSGFTQWEPRGFFCSQPGAALPLTSEPETKLSLTVHTSHSGFQSRRCQCWRAWGWGRSSCSHCSWTRPTGRAKVDGKASTSWLMSLRDGLRFSSPTSMPMGSKLLQWTCDGSHTIHIWIMCSLAVISWCHFQCVPLQNTGALL